MTVTPFAFDVPEIAIDVIAVELGERTFASTAALRETLGNATRISLSGVVTGR